MKKIVILLFLCSFVLSCGVDPPEGQLECATADDCPLNWKCDTDMLCYPNPADTAKTADSDDSTSP